MAQQGKNSRKVDTPDGDAANAVRRKLEKQLLIYEDFISCRKSIIFVLNEFHGRVLRSNIGDRLEEKGVSDKFLVYVSSNYISFRHKKPRYMSAVSRHARVDTSIFEIHVVTDSIGRIDAKETIELFMDDCVLINLQIGELNECLSLMPSANEEWEKIKKLMNDYRVKYPVPLWRNDYF